MTSVTTPPAARSPVAPGAGGGAASQPPRPSETAPAASGTAHTDRIAALEAEIRALREGQAAGQDGTPPDGQDREQANDPARAQQVLLSAIDYAIITMDSEGCITGWNPGAQAIIGYTEAEAIGQPGDIVFTPEDRESGRFILELCRALEHGRADNDRWHIRRDGTRFWASGLMMPLLGPTGQPEGFLSIMRDRSETRVHAEHRELIMAEMNHRVKNTLAMVQAIAGQTSRHAAGLADFQAAFSKRLAALAHSHDLLIQGDWEEAPLRALVEGALGAFCGQGRVTIDGPPVLLAAKLVVTLTLAFHELTTNATKHGALSVPSGSIGVSWRMRPAAQHGRQVELLWQERGGPAVRPPDQKGFGSHLLERGLKPFGVSLRLDFQPGGLECHLVLPIGTKGQDRAPPDEGLPPDSDAG
ncbi:MAG: sensor histidine kinase [Janthinobacterium lividum]